MSKWVELGQKLGSKSHIIPIIIGENKDTIELCEILFHNGYFTLPIRPPTVPVGTSRLRLSLTTDIEESEEIERAIDEFLAGTFVKISFKMEIGEKFFTIIKRIFAGGATRVSNKD